MCVGGWGGGVDTPLNPLTFSTENDAVRMLSRKNGRAMPAATGSDTVAFFFVVSVILLQARSASFALDKGPVALIFFKVHGKGSAVGGKLLVTGHLSGTRLRSALQCSETVANCGPALPQVTRAEFAGPASRTQTL